MCLFYCELSSESTSLHNIIVMSSATPSSNGNSNQSAAAANSGGPNISPLAKYKIVFLGDQGKFLNQ